MRELAVQSANGSNNAGDRANLQTEFAELVAEVGRLVNGTQFNGTLLFDGSTPIFTFQVGPGTTANDTIDIAGADLTANVRDAVAALDISGADAAGARAAIDGLDLAIDAVTTSRALYGAAQNRFESVVANLQVSAENLSAARSRIMDADFAVETANLSRAQILQQAGNAMVAQANALPQNVLRLLQQ
jgi:flagellin